MSDTSFQAPALGSCHARVAVLELELTRERERAEKAEAERGVEHEARVQLYAEWGSLREERDSLRENLGHVQSALVGDFKFLTDAERRAVNARLMSEDAPWILVGASQARAGYDELTTKLSAMEKRAEKAEAEVTEGRRMRCGNCADMHGRARTAEKMWSQAEIARGTAQDRVDQLLGDLATATLELAASEEARKRLDELTVAEHHEKARALLRAEVAEKRLAELERLAREGGRQHPQRVGGR